MVYISNWKLLYASLILFLLSIMITACSPMIGYQRNELITAAKKGNISRTSSLLSKGAYINSVNSYGTTALHSAVYYGQFEVVKLLISEGADLNPIHPKYGTPLYLAIMNDHGDIAKHLVNAGADINIPNSKGATPLWGAAFRGDITMVELLISNGADVNYKAANNLTVLFAAITSNHNRKIESQVKSIVELLLKAGADPKTKVKITKSMVKEFGSPILLKEMKVLNMDFIMLTPTQIAKAMGHHSISSLLMLKAGN